MVEGVIEIKMSNKESEEDIVVDQKAENDEMFLNDDKGSEIIKKDIYFKFSAYSYWKRKDGSKIEDHDKFSLNITLLNDITNYLKINEKKTDRIHLERRRAIPLNVENRKRISEVFVSEKKIKKEKKPKKDCVCGIESLPQNRRDKIMKLLQITEKIDDAQLDEILNSLSCCENIHNVQLQDDTVHNVQIQDDNVHNVQLTDANVTIPPAPMSDYNKL